MEQEHQLKTKKQKAQFAKLLRDTAVAVETGVVDAVYLGRAGSGSAACYMASRTKGAMGDLGTCIAIDVDENGWEPPWY